MPVCSHVRARGDSRVSNNSTARTSLKPKLRQDAARLRGWHKENSIRPLSLPPPPLPPASRGPSRHEIIINTLGDRVVLRAKLIRKRGSRGTMGADFAWPMANTRKEGGRDGEGRDGRKDLRTTADTMETKLAVWPLTSGCAPPTSCIRIRIRCFDCVLMPRAMSTTAALRHCTDSRPPSVYLTSSSSLRRGSSITVAAYAPVDVQGDYWRDETASSFFSHRHKNEN